MVAVTFRLRFLSLATHTVRGLHSRYCVERASKTNHVHFSSSLKCIQQLHFCTSSIVHDCSFYKHIRPHQFYKHRLMAEDVYKQTHQGAHIVQSLCSIVGVCSGTKAWQCDSNCRRTWTKQDKVQNMTNTNPPHKKKTKPCASEGEHLPISVRHPHRVLCKIILPIHHFFFLSQIYWGSYLVTKRSVRTFE